VPYVFPVVFCKAEQEHGPVLRSIYDDRAVSARPSVPLPGNALLDQPAAQICVDDAAFSPRDCFDEACVVYVFLPCELGEGPSF